MVAKAETKNAVSLTALMAQVFALYVSGELKVNTDQARSTLQTAETECRKRLGLDPAEEREARSEAFKLLRRR